MINSTYENPYMLMAIDKAKEAYENGEVPVGAVIVDKYGEVIHASGNAVISSCDPTAHAELLVIKNASKKLKTSKLNSCDLYVTLEPCPMCSHAISLSRIRRLYFGAYDTNNNSLKNKQNLNLNKNIILGPEVISGLNELKCSHLLKIFLNQLR